MKSYKFILLIFTMLYSEKTLFVHSQENSTVNDVVCGSNETKTNCINECGLTCSDVYLQVECIKECHGIGCTCHGMFVRDPITNKCVIPQDCTKLVIPECPKDKKFYPCYPCLPTCENPNPVCTTPMCMAYMKGRCDCASGLFKDRNNQCVKECQKTY